MENINILKNVLTIILALFGFGLSFWVLLANKKSKANRYLFAFIVLSLLFILSDYISVFFEGSLSTQFIRLAYGFGPLAIGAFYFLCSNFPNRNKQNKFIDILVISYFLLFSTLSFFTSMIVLETSKENWGVKIIDGKLNILYSVLLVSIVILSFYNILRKYRKSLKAEKTRIKFFLLGTIIFAFAETIFTVTLPLFGIEQYYFFGDYSILFFFGLTAYAIVKHRLMDIRMVVARSVAYAIMIAILAGIYIGSVLGLERVLFPEAIEQVSFGQILLRAAITLVIVFTFQPLKRFITKMTDKVFFKQAYEPDELLDTLAHTMSSSIVLIELLYKILHILSTDMKVSRGFFVILKKDEKTIDTTQGAGYKKSPQIGLKEIETVSKDGLCIYDELEEGSRLKSILRKYEASIAIPLKSKDHLSGILFLGEKSSGDMYSAQDIRIFEILGPEVTVAIENARSYEEIQQFNVVLREEIAKATKDLEKANQNLKELDKAKDEFISMASHQLRTPLTAIKGYLSMLLEGDAGEIKVGQYEFVQEAYYGATRMVSLINDLLNVSRMETGRFFLEVTEFDLTRVVGEEVKQLEKPAKDKGLKLVYQKHGHVSLCADEMKVRQVVMNFIDNAIYYTLDGKVVVNLYDEGKNVRFEVTDNGIGVPKEQQKHLFTKFYRAENARSARPDGTGLGLFMAKKVIEEHYGELIFHSVEGKGSTFGFRLPKVSKVTEGSASSFDPNIPLETPVDKAIEVMDEKMKEKAKVE